MLVATPRTRNSASARRARRTAVPKSRPRQVSLTSSESKCADTSAPTLVPPSNRMPAPPGVRYARDATGVGPETVGGVLGGDAALKRRSSGLQPSLAESEIAQRLAAGDPQLAGDQIDVGDLFGHGVLHLDPRIHLDEYMVAALIEQEFHGARAGVVDLHGQTRPRRHRFGHVTPCDRFGAGASSSTF